VAASKTKGVDEPVVVSIIPARGGSRGIPRKNLVPVAGRPLIAWSIEQARNARLVDRVFVSTDDDEIARVSREGGAGVVERPAELATDAASSEEALLHAIDVIERTEAAPVDLVVFLQATSPVREGEDIDNAIRHYRSEGADSLFSCTRIRDYFIWEEKDGAYVGAGCDYRNRKPRQGITPRYLENGSIYVFTPGLIRKEHNRLGGRIAIYEMPMWKSFQIDHRGDVELCEFYLRKLPRRKENDGRQA